MLGNYIHALIAMSLYFLYFLALLNTQPFLFSILDTYRKLLWLETYKMLVPQKFVKIFTLEIKEKKELPPLQYEATLGKSDILYTLPGQELPLG